MLKFVKTETFKAEVFVSLITADPHKTNDGSFIATYKFFDREAFLALTQEELSDGDFLRRVLVSVAGLGDAEGNEFPPDVAMETVIGNLQMAKAAWDSFIARLSGAATKNAKPSRGR